MSSEIRTGSRVLFRADPADEMLTSGIAQGVRDGRMLILSRGQEFERPLGEVKPGTQDTDPSAWMLHDAVTSTRNVPVYPGCCICEDPEYQQMGLPLCYPCPECEHQGRGKGHIPADDTVCDVCGHDVSPGDYPGPQD